MSESEKRLWGIDAIAGIYGLVTVLLVWLIFNASDVGRTFAMILAPIFAILCIGISLRINVVRVALITLLGISVVADVLLVLLFFFAVVGVIDLPPNKDPAEELSRMPYRLGVTLTMFFYLRRADVREAFKYFRSMETRTS